MSVDQSQPTISSAHDYACAIGSALLALNTAESEIFALLQQLAGDELNQLEGKFFSEKINALERYADDQRDPRIRDRLLKIVSEGRRLGDDRNNFAHGGRAPSRILERRASLAI